jgi:ABC-type branched-subunit amino acid transport system ATPase component
MSMLVVQGIAKAFGAVRAVADVSFSVEERERVALIGPNGSGKTTVFNLVSGVFRPDRGTVAFNGTDITGHSTHRIARLGLVRTFQHASTFPALSVEEGVAVALEMTPRSRAADRFRNVDEVLDVCGVRPIRAVGGHNLSYGNARLANLAIAVAAQPDLLLLDEPAAGLNDYETGLLAESLRRINEAGVALVVIDHDMGFIAGLCERTVVLGSGAVIASGTFTEVSIDPKVKEIYLGEPVGEEVAG